MTTAEQNRAAQPTTVVLPLHDLVVKLRQHGFVIRPDDYIEMLKVVETFGARPEEIDAALLCPLIATSPEEQERFYKVFSEYKKEQESGQRDDDAREKSRLGQWGQMLWMNRWWLFPLLLLLVGSALYFSLRQKPVLKPQSTFTYQKISSGDDTLRIGDSVTFDASAVLPPANADSSLQFFWNTGDGFKRGEAVSFPVHLSSEGSKTIQLKIRSANYVIPDSTQSLTLHVCPAAPQVAFTGLTTNYALNDELAIQPVFKGRFAVFYWKVNDSIIMPGKDPTLHYRFSRTGDYSVEFFGFLSATDKEQSPCIVHKRFDQISITDHRYSLQATARGKPLVAAANRTLNPLLYLLFLPALLIGAGTFLWWRKKQNAANDEGEKAAPKTYQGRKPPYETPFENKDLKLTEPENGFRHVYQAFRQKAEDEQTAFNVPASIRQTIRTGGLPELVFTNRLRYTDYVVLIDRTVAKSLQVKLFDFLVNRLLEEEITVERFYYSGKFENITNETTPDGLSFQRFAELYKKYTLIIMGTARQLVFGAYPVLEKQLADTLQEWEYKAILTPVAYSDWREKERLIAQKFILLPADLEGQLILLQAIREKSLNQQKYLASFASVYETEPFDFEAIEDIRAYLGDEVLFQWLCATAVYHKLRWEILIEVGKLICARYDQPEKMNFTNLLKLCRIRWVADGIFPPGVRLELLKALLPENEVAARETLLQMLRYAETYFGGDRFFEEEKDVQKITSQFLLYANNPEHYADYAASQVQFKALLDSGRLWDTPQKVYLENPGGRWTTLVRRHGRSTGINEYFNEKKLAAVKQDRKRLWRNAAAAASFVLLLAGLFLFRNQLPSNSFLVKAYPGSKNVLIQVRNDAACGGSSQQRFYQGVLQIGTKNSQSLQFDNNGLARVSISDDEIGQESYLMIGAGSDQTTAAASFVRMTSDTIRAVISACPQNPKAAVNIVYNDSARQTEIENIATFLRQQGYEVKNTTLETVDTATAVYYFADSTRNRADTLARLLRYQFSDIFAATRTIKDVTVNAGRNEALGIMVNFKQNGDTAMVDEPLVALGSQLTEIWHGKINNRLITIRPPLIYYSTAGKQTFGTYRILQSTQTKEGPIRILTRFNQQYAVFFVRNVDRNGFELAACQTRYKTESEAAVVSPATCSAFDRMSLYYENDQGKVFLPLAANRSFETSNEAKLKSIAALRGVRGKMLYNPRFGSAVPKNLPFTVTESVPLSNATPFDRSFLAYAYTGAPVLAAQCETTYSSLAELQKLNGTANVCKLSLAGQGLSGIPSEVYNLPDLKWLDLRKNKIPAAEIQKFRDAKPNVTVLADPATNETPAAPERRLTQVAFDPKYSLTPGAQQTLSQILSYLQTNSNATVRVVIRSFVTRDDGLRTKSEYASLESFLSRNKYNSRQWKIEVGEPQNVQQQVQQNAYSPNAENRFVADVYGTNFPQNFLQQKMSKSDY